MLWAIALRMINIICHVAVFYIRKLSALQGLHPSSISTLQTVMQAQLATLRPTLSLEIVMLISDWLPEHSLSAFTLCSRAFWHAVDKRRYTSPHITSFRRLIGLCKALKTRPWLTKYPRCLTIDWRKRPPGASPDTPGQYTSALTKLICSTIGRVTSITALRIVDLDPSISTHLLLSISPHVRELVLEVGDAIYNLAATGELQTYIGSLPLLSSVSIPSPIPRGQLRPIIKSLSSESPTITNLSVAVHAIDFGIIQEITLNLKGSLLTDLNVSGYFKIDPYTVRITHDRLSACFFLTFKFRRSIKMSPPF